MIAAVVVTYAAPPGALERCLAAVVDEVDRVIVVDTGRSVPADAHPRVELVPVPNDGYGVAANVGFARATALGADVVVLLNDDVVGRPGWVSPLVAALAGERVGAAQPVLVVAGAEPPIVNSRGVRIGPDGAGIDIGDGDAYEPATGAEPLDIFTGGAVAFSAGYLAATGGFDRRWFLYYEDVDLAHRGAAAGWSYVLVHDSVVEHERGSTTAQMPARTRYLQERNRLWAAFRFADAATIARAIWLSVRRVRHTPRPTHARALVTGLAGAPREVWLRARAAAAARSAS